MRHFDGAKPALARDRRMPHGSSEGRMPRVASLDGLGFYWNQGIWPQYIGAVAWTLGCMQGELNGNNVAAPIIECGCR